MLAKINCSFSIGPPVYGDSFIDRKIVVEKALEIISKGTGNLLISADRRVGKTSLCLKLVDITKGMDSLLSSYMSMEANYGKSSELFTQGVLVHSIKSIARSIYSKNYSDLLFDLNKGQSLDKDYAKLLRLFEIARRGSKTIKRSKHSEAGIKLVARADISETNCDEITIPPLSSFEYLNLLDETIEFIKSKSLTRIVFFVDEANKLALKLNSKIIRENLSVFSAQGMQFCFVSTPKVTSAVAEANNLFHNVIELGPFENIGYVRELIEKSCTREGSYVDAKSIFKSDAIDAIWKLSKGLPYEIQKLCDKSVKRAIAMNREKVALDDVLDVA